MARPCQKSAFGLSESFEEFSPEVSVRTSELIVQFWVEEKINKTQLIFLIIFHNIVSITLTEKHVEKLAYSWFEII